MNWQKQMEDILTAWTDTQRRVWDQWMNAVKGMTPGAEHMQAQYHQQLDAWESAVREALARQQAWAESWSGQSVPDGPQREMAEQWLGQIQEAMRGWTEAQSQLWNSWMESVHKMDTPATDMPWGQGAEEVVEAWRKAADQAQETMQEWSRETGAAAATAPSGGSTSQSSGSSGSRTSSSSSGGTRKGSSTSRRSGRSGSSSSSSSSPKKGS